MGKVKHWRRAAKLARSVTTWYPDPKVPGREVGWVEELHPYDRPTRQLAIRNRKNVAYVPWFWRYIMLIIRHVPEFLFKRMKM